MVENQRGEGDSTPVNTFTCFPAYIDLLFSSRPVKQEQTVASSVVDLTVDDFDPVFSDENPADIPDDEKKGDESTKAKPTPIREEMGGAQKQPGDIQKIIAQDIGKIERDLPTLEKNADKARTALAACQRQFLQDIDKCATAQIAIDNAKASGAKNDTILTLHNRLDLLSSVVAQIETDVIVERAIAAQPKMSKLEIACLQIASGQDDLIAKGEKDLLEIVRQNPNVPIDPSFNEMLLKAYLKMFQIRKEQNLPPWSTKIQVPAADRVRASEMPAIDKLKKANEVFWTGGVDKALPEFESAIEMARKSHPHYEIQRMALFVEALKVTVGIAEVATENGDITKLTERLDRVFADELEIYEKTQILKSVEVNTAFVKIASGRADLLTQGKADLLRCIAGDPSIVNDPHFKESLKGAFIAHHRAVEKNNPMKDPEIADNQPQFRQNFDNIFSNPEIANDAKIARRRSDVLTDIGTVGGVALLAIMLFNWRITKHRAAREAKASFGPTALEDLPKSVTTKAVTENGAVDQTLEVKGRMQGTDLIVIENKENRADWKSRSNKGIPAPEGFDCKKAQNGEYKRLHVDGFDYFVDGRNKVFVYSRGRLYPTEQVEVLTKAQFEALANPPAPDTTPEYSFDPDRAGSSPQLMLDDPKELIEEATRTKSYEYAKACVLKLVAKAPGSDRVAILQKLATEGTLAAMPALQELGRLAPEAAEKIITEGLSNDRFLKLVHGGQVKVAEILASIGPENRVQFLSKCWDNVTDKTRLANSILSTNESGFEVELSEQWRQKAIDFLIENRPAGYEKSLYKVMALNNDLSNKLKPRLERLWTTQTQTNDGKSPSVSEFLIGDRLNVIRQRLEALKWKDGTTPSSLMIYKNWSSISKENKIQIEMFLSGIKEDDLARQVEENIYKPDRVRGLLKGNKRLLADYGLLYPALERETKVQQALNKILEARQELLEKALHDFCKEIGVPAPKVELAATLESPKWRGSHLIGTPQVEILAILALDGNGPSKQLISTLLHETVHLEQGGLVTWDVLDGLKAGKTLGPDERQKAKDVFQSRTARLLSDALLDTVLELRNGMELTPEQHTRAVKLAEGFLAQRTDANSREMELGLESLVFRKQALDHGILFLFTGKRNVVETTRRLLMLDKLPPSLETKLAELEKDGFGKDSSELMKEVNEAVKELAKQRISELSERRFSTYKDSYHETETFACQSRAELLMGKHEEDLDRKRMAQLFDDAVFGKGKSSIGKGKTGGTKTGTDTKASGKLKTNTAGGTDPISGSDQKNGGEDATKPPGSDLLMREVYESLPRGMTFARAEELNGKLRRLFGQPPWDSLTPDERRQKSRQAFELMEPVLKEQAKMLGLPESLITADRFVFDSMPNGVSGAYNIQSDRVRLNVNGLYPFDAAMHELTHNMQWLEIVAAAKADPSGFRLAMMDSCLSGIDVHNRVLDAFGNVVERHRFKSDRAKADFKKYVESLIQNKLSQAPKLDLLIAEFGSFENLQKAVDLELHNFNRLVELPGECKLDEHAKNYVDSRINQFHKWRHSAAGASLVRIAINEMEKDGNNNARDKSSFAEIRKRIVDMVTRDGRVAGDLNIPDEFIAKVIDKFDSAPTPELKDPFGVIRTGKLDLDAESFKSPERNLRSNPMLNKLLRTATLDRVGRVSDGTGEYAFSSFEISAGKIDAANRAKRAHELIKSGQLDKAEQAVLETDFRELVRFIKVSTKQQQIHLALLDGNQEKARTLAKELVGMLKGDIASNTELIYFLKECKLISDQDLPADNKPKSQDVPKPSSETTGLEKREIEVARRVLGSLRAEQVPPKVFASLLDSELLRTTSPDERIVLESLLKKVRAADPQKNMSALVGPGEAEFNLKGGTAIAGGKPPGVESPLFNPLEKPVVLSGTNNPPTAFQPLPTRPIDEQAMKDKEGAAAKKPGAGASAEAKPTSPAHVAESKAAKYKGRAIAGLILLDAVLDRIVSDKKP